MENKSSERKVIERQITRAISGAVGGAFDAAMSSNPATAIPWGAIKGGVSALKESRAVEFIEFIKEKLEKGDFENESMVDGLAVCFESYLKQRNEIKRRVIKNILLGFKASDDKDNFNLEKILDVLDKITVTDAELLKKLNKDGSCLILERRPPGVPYYDESYDSYKYLEYLGLLVSMRDVNIRANYDESFMEEDERIYISDFGKEFLKYIYEE